MNTRYAVHAHHTVQYYGTIELSSSVVYENLLFPYYFIYLCHAWLSIRFACIEYKVCSGGKIANARAGMDDSAVRTECRMICTLIARQHVS